MLKSDGRGGGFPPSPPPQKWCLVRIRVNDGRGEVEVSQWTWDEGVGGVHKGHFHTPAGMVVRGGGRQSICQPASYVTEEHSFFVKGILTDLALGILGAGAGKGGGEGRYGPGRG